MASTDDLERAMYLAAGGLETASLADLRRAYYLSGVGGGGITDAGLTAIAADPDSDFATELKNTIGGVVDEASSEIVASVAPASRPSDATLAGAVTRRYEPSRSTYAAQASTLRKFRGKLAAALAGTALLEIACLGDSIVAGQGSTISTQSWPVVLKNALMSRYGLNVGTGWVPLFQANASTLRDNRWTIPGNWTQAATYMHAAVTSTSGGAALRFTSDTTGAVAEVYYSGSSGPFTVSIDGGTPVAVTPSGSTMLTYTVTGLAGTTHTIDIVATSPTATYIYAARVRYSKGVSVSNWGYSNSQASHWLTSSWYLNSGYVKATNPDILLVGLGTNEAGNATPAATYKTNMEALLDVFPNPEKILLAPIPLGTTNLTAYRRALYEIAEARGLIVIDLFDRWGSAASATSYGMYSDASIHPSAIGYTDIGLGIFDALTA